MSSPTVATPTVDERSRWSGGQVTAVVIGTLFVLLALVLLAAGGTGLWAEWTQRDDGYVTTGTHHFSTSGSALATEDTRLGSAGIGWLYSPGLLGKVRIRITPSGSAPLFVGVARSSDADRYLSGVSHTVISDFFGNKTDPIAGQLPAAAPSTRHFWVATSTGTGRRTLVWKPKKGTWTVVTMNADAKPGLAVQSDLGARMPAVRWLAIGLVLGGVVFLIGGGFLIAGAFRGRRARTTASEGRIDARH